MEIRRVGAEAFDLIWPMLEAEFRAGLTYAVDPQITKEAACAYWIGAARESFVALDGDQVLGTYYLKANQPGFGDHVCNCGYVVAEAARGRGLAAQMCLHSQERARALGFAAMQFNFVLESNRGAVALWHRLGFETLGTIPRAYRHPVEGLVAAHLMWKAL